MGNKTYDVSGITLITNYKPVYGRKATEQDVTYKSDDDKEIKVDKRYSNIFDRLQFMDGKKGLSWDDALKAKQNMEGKYGIKKVAIDKDAKVVSFTMNDNTYLRIDIDIEDSYPALKFIKQARKEGKAEYHGTFYNAMDHCFISTAGGHGKTIYLYKVPQNCQTYGDLKRELNLPDGCMRRNFDVSGNYDKMKITLPVQISVEALAKAYGLTEDQIQSIADN